MEDNSYNFEIDLASNASGKNLAFLTQFILSEKIKRGFKEVISLDHGLKLVINEYKTKKNISINFKISNAPIEFAFCLSGRMNVEIYSKKGTPDFLEVTTGASALFYLPDTNGILTVYANEPLKMISLHCSPDYLMRFLDKPSLQFNEEIDLINKPIRHFIEMTKSNSSLRNAANQIIESKFEGKMREIFLELKANELIILLLEQIRINYSDEKTEIITKNDLSKAAEIESILKQNLAEVPSLIELSDIASMTHTKLSRVFKNIYGNTVFGYLRELRLDKAKELLEAGKLSITEISYETGWSSPSHLSREFRDKFGITPSLYSKNTKKNS
jgi:AraC-like DNA-binding protein